MQCPSVTLTATVTAIVAFNLGAGYLPFFASYGAVSGTPYTPSSARTRQAASASDSPSSPPPPLHKYSAEMRSMQMQFEYFEFHEPIQHTPMF